LQYATNWDRFFDVVTRVLTSRPSKIRSILGKGKYIYLFSEMYRPALRPIQPPTYYVPASFSVSKRRGVELTIQLHLTLTLLTWIIWWAPNNARKWQMGFNLAFKGLILRLRMSGARPIPLHTLLLSTQGQSYLYLLVQIRLILFANVHNVWCVTHLSILKFELKCLTL
jgi:hypothetical protein